MTPQVATRTNNQNEADKDVNIEHLCKRLTLDMKSPIPKPQENENCKCLIRFHNCTPHRVTPYWIDFNGRPIKYPVLSRGASINIDTYASHLWYFMIDQASSDGASHGSLLNKKVLALPEETLNSSCNAANYSFLTDEHKQNDKKYSREQKEKLLNVSQGSNFVLICSLCKYVLKKYSRLPADVPCAHFTGEAKLSASDLECRSRTTFNALGYYIYTCSDDTHCKDHAKHRRNVFLVESFYNLRERCFLTINNGINHSDIVDLNLPMSLQKDYIQFLATMRKLNDRPIS